MQILAPLLSQLIVNPNLKLNDNKMTTPLDKVDNDINELQKKLNL
jgi:hypothetical protein